MTYRWLPSNLPDLLRAAGLTVVEIDGWETRGRPATTGDFHPVGVLNHHTGAFDREGDLADDLAYAKWLFLQGRADLPAPLCQLSLSAEGTVYLGAAGRANHAGQAKSSGSVAAGDGNALYVGIEWMLSGTQPIPAKMYAAGATLNAVLLRLLGSSVQAASCHYQTSVTGKWDIGDPNGIQFGSARVLDMTKFRKGIQVEKDRLARPAVAAPEPETSTLSLQFSPLQFGDTTAQKTSDLDKIFGRGKHILGGTEAFKAGALLKAAAEEHGYRLHTWREEWVAVKRSLILGGWAPHDIPVIESFEGAGTHSDRGIVGVSFDTKNLGRITAGVSHYLTNGRKPGDPNFVLNRRLADAIGDWARAKAKGTDIVFYMGDQNDPDNTSDTFHGSPLTSIQDELDEYEKGVYGPIEVIASYDADGRVKAKGVNVLTDGELPLHIDHPVLVATYTVRWL